MLPNQIGRYEIKGELGRGGMASVYRALDPRFKREVAIKVLPREFLHDPTFRARFEREAQTIAALEHPAIVPVHDYGEENDQPYLVMRLMTGGTLAERLTHGPLSAEETVRVLSRLAPALDRAHSLGIIHRDLKPGNILFDGDGNPHIADFGLAKMMQSNTQLSGTGVMGTPAYMSPEQAKGEKEVDGRADLYALGAIVYQMLTGKLPYEADTPIAVALKHVTEPPPRLREARPDLPSAADTVIARAMAKTPDERFATAGGLSAALQAAMTTIPSAETQRNAQPTLMSTQPVASPVITDTPAFKLPPSAPAAPPARNRTALGCVIAGLLTMLVLAGVLVVAVVQGGNWLYQQAFRPQPTAATPNTGPGPIATATPGSIFDIPNQVATQLSSATNLAPLVTQLAPLANADLTVFSKDTSVLVNQPDDKLAVVSLVNTVSTFSGETKLLVIAYNADKSEILWASEETLSDEAFGSPVVVGPKHVFVMDRRKLVALDRVTGKTAWTAILTDTLNFCTPGPCLRVIGETVVVLASDSILQGLDIANGEERWQRELSTAPRALYVLGEELLYIDEDAESDGLLRFVQPATGESRTFKPTCGDFGRAATPYPYSPIYLTPDGQGFYLLFGSSPGCLHLYRAGTEQPVWVAQMPEATGFPSDVPALITEAAAYLALEQRLVRVNAATGERTVLLDDERYHPVPLLMRGEALLVRATDVRGTPSYALWALDAQTGDRRWTVELDEATPLDPPDEVRFGLDEGKPAWTWLATESQFALLRFRYVSSTQALLGVERLDVATGKVQDSQELEIAMRQTGVLSVYPIARRGDRFWFSITYALFRFDWGQNTLTQLSP
jgi:serine/threonine-protein kinase